MSRPYIRLPRPRRASRVWWLQVEIDRAGQVSAVRIVAGDAMLGEAAAAAVRQWTMEPMEIGGWRVEAYTEIEISFALQR